MTAQKIRDEALKILPVITGALGTRRTIYVAGNGGSAAVANHLACDWLKTINVTRHDANYLRVISLAANQSVLTALGNDFGYDCTYSEQIRWLANRDDIIVLISSSGVSENMVCAARLAKQIGCCVIAFTGFKGGPLRELADYSVHIESQDYGITEDYHSAVMHDIVRLVTAQSGAVGLKDL